MEKFSTITEEIRYSILNRYEVLRDNFDKKFSKSYELEEEFVQDDFEFFDYTEPDDFCDDIIGSVDEDFEKEVFQKMITEIENSKYKNITHLIMLQDVWEYLKVNQVLNMKFLLYETEMLEFIQNWDIKTLLRKIKTSNDFYLDLLITFIEYLSLSEVKDRMKNKKILELTNNYNGYEKFKIGKIDDIEYQYTKTRGLY